MKIIFIYGPPAAGKLTVAQELAKITSYKLFHNHLIVDLARSLLRWCSKEYLRVYHLFMLEMLKSAAKEKVKGVIMTYVYAHPPDNKSIKELIKLSKKIKAPIYFVYLRPEDKELFKRVKMESRQKYRKLKNASKLKASLKKWDFRPIPFVDNLLINNTNIPAKKVAVIIKKHYHL